MTFHCAADHSPDKMRASLPERSNRPWYAAIAVGSLLVFSQCASALTIDFNGTAPPGGAPNVNPSYSTSGFTFTALSSTSIYLLDPDYDNSNAPPDNSDFFTMESGSPTAIDLSSDNPTFSLQSFRAAAIYDDPAGNLTVTGNLSGGGSLVEVFALPSGNPTAAWNTYTLASNWNNLTSVTFEWGDSYVGLDDVVVDGSTVVATTAVPVMPLWLLSILGGLIGVIGLKRLRPQ